MVRKRIAKSSGVKISRIAIEKFRRFTDAEFEIGPQVTIIAGQNGTCKSTLLGMLCQPFTFSESKKKKDSSYTANYDGLDLGKYKTLTGDNFKSEYSEVFRMAVGHDKSQDHRYTLFLSGDCISDDYIRTNGLFVISRWRDSSKRKIRMVAGKGREHNLGSGNFPHPVIYLGLNRLCPLAKCLKMKIDSEKNLSQEDKQWFVKMHNEILVLREPDNHAEFVKTHLSAKNDFFGPAGKDYSSESCSAGQDNLGQILTAILSFKNLGEELGEKYQGGLLLIDEFDNTFHPVAQLKLLKFLGEAAREYNLQVVLTTHSLEILRNAYENPYRAFIKTIYLIRQDSRVIDSGFSQYSQVEANLRVMATEVAKSLAIPPVTIIFEDAVGAAMFSAIIGNQLTKYVKTYSSFDSQVDAGSISGNILPHFAKLAIPEFQKVIFVVDGDLKREEGPKRPNLIALPGEMRPESLLYSMLNSLSDKDEFWGNAPRHTNYTAQVCFENCMALDQDAKKAKEQVKKWFFEQKKYWGRNAQLAFDRWILDHHGDVRDFCMKFLFLLEHIRGAEIDSKLKEKILSEYSSVQSNEEDEFSLQNETLLAGVPDPVQGELF